VNSVIVRSEYVDYCQCGHMSDVVSLGTTRPSDVAGHVHILVAQTSRVHILRANDAVDSSRTVRCRRVLECRKSFHAHAGTGT
jgi:hypothetical protein